MTAFVCGYKTFRDRKEREEKVTVAQNYSPNKKPNRYQYPDTWEILNKNLVASRKEK